MLYMLLDKLFEIICNVIVLVFMQTIKSDFICCFLILYILYVYIYTVYIYIQYLTEVNTPLTFL